MRVLVVRNDKLGDLVLALPLLDLLKRAGHKTSVWASAYAAPLLRTDPRVESVLQGADEIKAGRFDAALVLWPNWSNAWAVFAAGVPLRVGISARPFSMLFNRRLPLRRSAADRHESEYNAAFGQALGLETEPLPPPRLHLDEAARREAKAWLKARGPQGKGPLVALHPGSGGSAQNWLPQRWAELGLALKKKHKARLLVSGGPDDAPAMDACRKALGQAAVLLRPSLALRPYAALLGELALFCAASTGPLHLAAAQGTPVLGLYPPLAAMSPLRWAPRGSERAVLSPAGLGTRLKDKSGRNFVERISVDEALAAAGFLLRD
jgi:ADP-heptose:LPS heptosyltransferase